MVCPETESAVHTIPASAMTKNMPVVPETPKRSSTTEEMMMVSMVMPDTGLRAVVAMALAATEVKKNEKTQGQADAREHDSGRAVEIAEEDADGEGAQDHAEQDGHDGQIAVGAFAGCRARRAEGFERDAEGIGHDAQRLDDAEDARGGDGADADEADVAAEDLRGGHLRDGNGAGVDGGGVVAADHPDRGAPARGSRARRRRTESWNCAVP